MQARLSSLVLVASLASLGDSLVLNSCVAVGSSRKTSTSKDGGRRCAQRSRLALASLPKPFPFEGVASMLGGIKAGLQGEMPDGFEDKAPSWEDLEELLTSKQTKEEKDREALRETGKGPTDSLALLRLFDAPPGTVPRVKLYRDQAAWCPYCEKVWLQLEEKRIPYSIEKINMRCYGEKPAAFMSLTGGGGMLPVMELDGKVITESNQIIQALEDAFPDNKPLMAQGTANADKVPPLLQLERQLFSAWFRYLTSANMQPSQEMNFCSVMDEVEEKLGECGGPFFLGKEVSIVEVMFTPFLERMAASLPYFKGLLIRGNPRWPALNKWYDAMDTLPSYVQMKGDYYTHCHDLPPQVGGCFQTGDGVKYSDEIDGKNGFWSVPVKEGIEPWAQDRPAEQAAREAAARLVANHKNVAAFACRGVGTPGVPPVAAPLSDPNSNPNTKFVPGVDAALRHVVHALLEGTEAAQEAGLSEGMPTEQVRLSLTYLQERVGVPRDMRFEAAQQLRGHLGWYMEKL